MSVTRVHRLAVLAVVAGGLALLSPPRRVPAAPGGSRPVILFDSTTALPTVFSPDGNGARDSVEVLFTLPPKAAVGESVLVAVHVSPMGAPDTVRVLVKPQRLEAARTYRAEWRGEDETGSIRSDGIYTVHFNSLTIPDGRVLNNQRQVRLDRTPATLQILAVEPRRYTPTLPSAAVVPTIRVRVTRSEVVDRIGVAVIDPRGASQDTLNPEGGFGGDGDYSLLCRSCSFLADGVHRLNAFGHDLAGNDSTVVDSLDVNADGPALAASHPPLPRAQQRADSLVGVALDRHGVAAVTARIGASPDTVLIALPPRDGAPSLTYHWFLDTSTLLAAEGDYPVLLRATDVDGLRDSLQLTLKVDRTPPPRPRLDPPLPAVSKSPVLTGTVVVDTDQTSRLVLSGGTQPADTVVVSRTRPRIQFSRSLAMGANQLSFAGIDAAGNVSVAVGGTVLWDSSPGLVAPERFAAGNAIEVSVGATPAQAVFIRVLALDGSLVRTFADNSAKLHYQFPWDLRTPEGHVVKNGAYLVLARVRHASGAEERLRTMIAVVR